MIGQGVHGIATGGSTGEGHTLDADEFRRLIAAMGEEGGARKANSRSGLHRSGIGKTAIFV